MVTKQKHYLFFIVAALVFVLDQLSKLAVKGLQQPVVLIPSFLQVTYIENTGSSFGMLQGWSYFLAAMGIIIIIAFLLFFRSFPKDLLAIAAIGLILGGALGNTVDRLLLGHVVDFIDFSFWPAFNIADSAMTIGVVLLIFESFRKK